MRKSNWIIGAVVSACVAGFAISASAADANVMSCAKAGREVRAAIEKNQDAAKRDIAQKQQRYGVQFCNAGFYKKGMEHYEAAMKALGSSETLAAAQ